MVKISQGTSAPSTVSSAEEPNTEVTDPTPDVRTDEPNEPTTTTSTATVQTAAEARDRRRNDVGLQQQRQRLDQLLDGPASPDTFPPLPTNTPYRRAFRLDEPTFAQMQLPDEAEIEAAAAPDNLEHRLFLPYLSGPSATLPPVEQFEANSAGGFVFRGTTGDDTYVIKGDGAGGVSVEDGAGNVLDTLSAGDAAQGVRIWTAAGADNVTVDASLTVPLDIHGSSGDDVIDARNASTAMTINGGTHDDTIYGSAHADVLLGGAGDDTIEGGAGNDRIEGNRGADAIDGGSGGDQILGGEDDDTIDGGAGHDLIMGNAGNDTLRGNRGSDAIYADVGDTVHAGYQDASGNETGDGDDELVVAEAGVAVTGLDADDVLAHYDPQALANWRATGDNEDLVTIEGRDEFEEMIEADLGVMLSTAEGRGLLDEVAANGTTTDPVRIAEQATIGGTYQQPAHVPPGGSADNRVTVGMWTGQYGDGSLRHPNPILNHELVHARQDLAADGAWGNSTWSATGHTVSSREREATGLSYRTLNLLDPSGSTLHPDQDYARSDNAYRGELGLTERDNYAGEPAGIDPDGFTP